MFLRPYYRFLLMAALLAATATLANDSENGAGFRVRHWTTEDGLPQTRVACLKQTRDGYLWIGTWFGLARFDGMRFTVFDHINTAELAGNRGDSINALAEDRDGTLWIGTGNGLVSYRERKFRRLTLKDGLPELEVWRLASARDGGIWLMTGTLITRMKDGRFFSFPKPHDLGDTLGMSENADGNLDVFDQQAWLTVSRDATGAKTNVIGQALWRTAVVTERTNLWAGTANGLMRLAAGRMRAEPPYEWSGHRVGFLYTDRADALWASVDGFGFHRRSDGGWRSIDLGAGLSGASVTCVEEDAEGSYWVGTDAGLAQLQPLPVRSYTKRDGLADDNVAAVCEESDGTIWVESDLGIGCVRSNSVFDLTSLDEERHRPNRCLWPNARGGVWVGKVQDERKPCLFEVDQGKFVSRPPGDGVSPVVIFQDQSALWLGGREVRTVIGDNWAVTNWTAIYPALRDARCICGDGTNIWIGTKRHGLARWTVKGLTLFTNGLGGERIMVVMNDADGIVWLATENGLSRFCGGRFFAFTTDNGPPETAVNSIVADDFGCLWLGGLHGIHRVEREQLNAVADGRQRTAQFLTFDGADGMESPETNGGETQPGGWKAHDGRLWFATGRGVVTLDPGEIEKTLTTLASPPPVVVEQVKADNRVIFGDTIGGSESAAQIAPGHGRVMEFRFTANSFIEPQRLQFRYRLAGYETAWHEKTAERFVHYANLRPGRYQFEVAAINHHGVWSARTASFWFILLPRYWETWLFYAFCVLGAIGLAAGVQSYRLKWQHRLLKVEEQRTLASERARIARDLHDDLGTALTGLALELDVIGREPGEPPSITERLDKTSQRVRNLANRMREVVWTVNPDCDTVSSLASFIEQQVEQFLRLSNLNVRLEFPEDIPTLPLRADARHQLALGVREALTNVVRHANATEVVVSLEIADHQLVLRVQDNGCGSQPMNTEGNGLKNLRTRLEGLGGSFECVAKPGYGTTVTFRLPLKTKEGGI